MPAIALITGISGQDGSYLLESLHAQGYRVIGHIRDPSQSTTLVSQFPGLELVSFDLASGQAWCDLLERLQPTEIYHLAGMSFVPACWDDPLQALQTNVAVTICILEAIRRCSRHSRLFYACSSEIFGNASLGALDESTPINPASAYGVTKAASHSMIQAYRQQFDLFACSGILFNHESPRRPPRFVIRKISQAVAAIALGQQSALSLGNLDVHRDWGDARDFVDCFQRVLRHSTPEDFVIGTGRLCSLQELVAVAFRYVGLDWQDHVECRSELMRVNDRRRIQANPGKALELLGWQAVTPIESVMRTMVQHDIELLQGARGNRSAA